MQITNNILLIQGFFFANFKLSQSISYVNWRKYTLNTFSLYLAIYRYFVSDWK